MAMDDGTKGEMNGEALETSKVRLAQELYGAADDMLADLQRRREQLGLSAEELSVRLNRDKGYIDRVERGEEDLVSDLTDLCFQLGVSIRYDIHGARPAEALRGEETGHGIIVNLRHGDGTSEVVSLSVAPGKIDSAEILDSETLGCVTLTQSQGSNELIMEGIRS